MTLFYEKTLHNEVLAPFFVTELGDDLTNKEWEDHIELLADFWLAELLGKKTYIGNFVGAHVRISYITRESFVQWIALFSEAADAVYVPELAEKFKAKGISLSDHFMSIINV